MTSAPAHSWSTYRESIGDRSSLFAAVAREWGVACALYPGCCLDLSPSTAINDVTYVDVDKRAARYFANDGLAESELGAPPSGTARRITFIAADYTSPLSIPTSNSLPRCTTVTVGTACTRTASTATSCRKPALRSTLRASGAAVAA